MRTNHEGRTEKPAVERQARFMSTVGDLAGLLQAGDKATAVRLLGNPVVRETGALGGLAPEEAAESPGLFGLALARLVRAAQEAGGPPLKTETKRLFGPDTPARVERGVFLDGLGLPEEYGLDQTEEVETYRRRLRNRAAVLAELAVDFPDRKFSVLSSEGSSAFVLVREDEPDAVYKVYLPEAYDEDGRAAYSSGDTEKKVAYADEEARKLAVLGDGDDAVTVRLLEYRRPSVVEEKDAVRTGIGERLASTDSPLAMIKMSRVEFEPDGLVGLPTADREAAAARIAARLRQEDFYPGDVEFVRDRRTGAIVAIDAGGFQSIGDFDEKRRPARRDEIAGAVREHLRLDR